MSDLSIIPLEDWFETQLAQDWNGATGTVYVLDTPSYTPTTTNTYIVVNPWKTTMQIAEITDYDSTANTLTVSNVTLLKGLGINSTAPASSHATGSKVIISDNYQFWADIQTAINSKLDDTGGTMTGLLQFSGTTHAGIKLLSLTTVQRDALSASNGMIIYNSTTGELNQYIWGAWSAVAAGSTQPNASTTVAGKKEDPTDAETIAGTDVWGTGATMSPTPSQVAKNIQSGCFVYGTDVGGDDTYVVALTPTLTTYTPGQRLRAKLTTANNWACTIDFWPWVKNIKMIDGTDPLDGDIIANGVYDFIYDGTNMLLMNTKTNIIKFWGDWADWALAITSWATNIDCANAAVVIKNYSSISITGTASLTFTNPSSNWTVIILRSQGNVTLTSSATPMIDLRLMWGAGGAGVASSNSSNAWTAWSACFTNLFQTNAGAAVSSNNSTVGAGGAIPSFLWSNRGIVFNKYPILAWGSGGASGSIQTAASGSTGTSGAGGRWGGCLLIECGGALNFTTANGISVAWTNGASGSLANAGTDTCGGWGGWAGWLCAIYYNSLTANSWTVTVTWGTWANHVGIAHVNIGGGWGGGSVTTAWSAGTKNEANWVKDWWNWASWLSIVEVNTLLT